MADKQVVAAVLTVDTGNSNANIKEVNKNVNEVNASLEKTGATAKKTGGEIQESTGHFGKLKEQMSAIPGPLGEAGEGVNKLSTAFKALLANPVVLVLAAIVATLALLYKAFTNTFEGGQKMEQVFAGIKAAGQALLDNLEKIGSAIVKLFKFDFSGAVAEIKGVAKAAGDAYSQMAKLTAQAQQLKREQSQNDLEQAQRATRLAKLREDALDETIPIAKRKALLLDLQKEQDADAIGDIARAKKIADNKIAMLTLEKDGDKKNLLEINEARIEAERVSTDAANEGRRIAKQIRTAEKQEEAERKQEQKDREDRAKEAAEAAKQRLRDYEDELKRQDKIRKDHLNSLKAEREATTDYGKLLAEEDAKADKEAADKKKKNDARNIKDQQEQYAKLKELHVLDVEADKALEEAKVNNRQRALTATSNILGQFSQAIGAQTAVGKAFAVAQTTIDTYQSAVASYKSLAGIPVVGPALGFAAAAAAVASGIANVKRILSVKVPGSSSSGSIPSGVGVTAPAAPIAPQAQSTALNQASLNNIGNAAAPVRAYVLDSDSENHRERNTRLNRASRLGG